MDVLEIKKTIKETLRGMMEDKNIEIRDDDFFYEDLGADSIMIVQVFLTCQEKFGVTLADELNLMEPVSVNSMTDLVLSKLQEKAS